MDKLTFLCEKIHKGVFGFFPGVLPSVFPEDIISWCDVNRILNQHRLNFPRMRLVKNGVELPEASYTYLSRKARGVLVRALKVDKFYEHLRSGSTLVIDSIDELHDPAKEVASSFANQLGLRTQANMYMSFGDVRGLSIHSDTHDVVVLQVSGKKDWFIYGNSCLVEESQSGSKEEPTEKEKPVWSRTLCEGDILYIPKGVRHDAQAQNSESLHIALGIIRKTPSDFLQWIGDKLSDNPFFARNIPLSDQPEELNKFTAQFQELLIEELSNYKVSDFLQDQRHNPKFLPNFNLPYPALEDIFSSTDGKFSLESNILNHSISWDESGQLIIDYQSISYKFHKATHQLFKCLVSKKIHPISDLFEVLPSKIEKDQCITLIKELVRNGLLNIIPK